MQTFIARNDKQLGLCLKLLFAENVDQNVKLRLTENNKIIYVISVNVSDEQWLKLESKYKILIG